LSSVLAIGAHPDDIEIGCGGALLAHRQRGDQIALLVMTNGERGPQDAKSRTREQEEAARLLGADLFWAGFDDGAVPDGRDGVDAVQIVTRATAADIVYTHGKSDTHQDHRATAQVSIAACRRVTRVLHYESPTTIGFQPMLHIDIAGLVEAKLELIRSHASQVLKNGLVDLEAVEAQARFRGFNARKRFTEGFEVSRFVWDLAPAASFTSEVDEADRLDLSLSETG